MNRTKTALVVLLVSLGFAMTTMGCSTRNHNLRHSPETLGRIGAAIDENPDRMKSILENHNLTAEEFEDAVDQVSSDPALARRYRKGFSSDSEDSTENGS